ncbi:tetratricopeptide repeat protein, partial [bacterium]|nr:tetratricopeptide repeat protein [bacterium]
KNKTAGFSIVFFILTFALVSNILLLVGTIMAERLIYLPSAGFCILLALSLNSLKSRKIVLALSLIILSFYAWIDIRRNADWKNDNTIFLKTLKTSPTSMKMMVNAGQSQLNLKHYEKARDLNLKAIKLSDKFPLPFSNLGVAYLKLGNMSSAEAAFQSALQRDPEYVDAWVNIGIIFAKQRRFDGAITAFEKALEYKPKSPKLHNNLALACKQKGVALHSMGDKKESLELFIKSKEHYEKALLLFPKYKEAKRNFSGLTRWMKNHNRKFKR